MNAITPELLHEFNEAYVCDNGRQLATLALSKSDLYNVAFSPKDAGKLRHKFSVEIPTMEVTNQKSSGRCWLFAATNVLRERIAKARNIEKFELSQSYLAFWDKFERCNYFLESMIATADLPTDDRTVMFILQTGVHDGGQWDMFGNIVRKYGIVPKDVYDETHQSSNTRQLNYVVNRALKIGAAKLRSMIHAGASDTDVQTCKNEILSKIYGFLCSCYGEPPKTFSFEWIDKDKKDYHVETGLTPLSFAERYGVLKLLDDTVSIIHAPTADKPYDKTFTIQFLGNVADGRPVCHLNLALSDFKAAIIAQLNAGKVVWFGSDVGHYGDRELGIWDDKSFNFDLLSGLDMSISKEDALNYSLSAMNHAMVITGVQIENGQPTRWRIENSWGDEKGDKGYYVCSDSWFDQYVYQAAVEKEYLGDKAPLVAQEPISLAPWDPMGTLAD
ncbi:MAG: C1 family peptidase [Clostridia bacterium]|nr:C1 family peptidase [Clostridia bacterium]